MLDRPILPLLSQDDLRAISAACKADATLLGDADLVGIGTPGQAPNAQPGSCGS